MLSDLLDCVGFLQLVQLATLVLLVVGLGFRRQFYWIAFKKGFVTSLLKMFLLVQPGGQVVVLFDQPSFLELVLLH